MNQIRNQIRLLLLFVLLLLSSVRGLVSAVEETNITVKDAAGKNWQFEITENLDVPVKHLQEHQKQKWPVTVYFQAHDGKKTALRITD